ncbi:2-aminoethylphosphonate--pyruvate aminotransferase [Burkholderia sola]|nr:2-aminoethylphosphonate--pyruvate aminotransferase [Burkholderia sola]MDF3082790.1 2-aminoethylphosphonate--pyruvate aminotransferase [Burkholderia sola]
MATTPARLGPQRGFYQAVKKRGYIRSRGTLAEVDALRVRCIGHFDEAGVPGAVAAIADTLKAMGVRRMSTEAMA